MKSFQEKLREGDLLKGTHIQMPVPEHAEIFALAGFDYIWIDTEHSPIDDRTLLQCINLVRTRGSAAVVRVPVHDYNRTKRVIEMAPDGVVFPMINTRELAEDAIRSTLYPPLGTRGFGPMRAVEYGNLDAREYVEKGVFKMARILQVETEEAVKNLREILKVPYVDGFVIGPCDLAASVGELCKEHQPITERLIRETAEILRECGKPFGVSFGEISDEMMDTYLKLGVTFVSSGVDFGYLLQGAKETRKRLNASMKKE